MTDDLMLFGYAAYIRLTAEGEPMFWKVVRAGFYPQVAHNHPTVLMGYYECERAADREGQLVWNELTRHNAEGGWTWADEKAAQAGRDAYAAYRRGLDHE